MLVKQIQEFISHLNLKCDLSIDKELYRELSDYFNLKDSTQSLNKDDLSFLEDQFKKRWNRVRFTGDDYTLTVEGANQLWIDLAKKLAFELEKTYIEILFPGVVNKVDLIDSTPLSDTSNPDNLYLSRDGRVLYRKYSLCQYLIKKNYVLSTRRNNEAEPSTLTLEELSRLKACKARKEVTIEDIQYPTFWDFLEIKVLSKFNETNKFPLPLIAQFLPLIDYYFQLKRKWADFSQFKKLLNEFLIFLYKHEKEEIHQFYGIYFETEKGKQYLYSYLMDMVDAKDYCLAKQLNELTNKLHCLNRKLTIKKSKSFSNNISSISENEKNLIQCRLMLLSLFINKFECNVWDKITINICDKENQVPSRAAKIFERFDAIISENNDEEMVRLYKAIISENLEETNTNNLSFRFLSRFFSSFIFSSWWEQVKTETLNLYWYDPKLILHALLHFHAINSETKNLISIFLDQLIQTYCQNPPIARFQKHMRINILFNEFLDSLKLNRDKDAILFMLDLSDSENYKDNFIKNCTNYIGQQLEQISGNGYGYGETFFANTRPREQCEVKIILDNLYSVSSVIQSYYREIENTKLDKDRIKNLHNYLTKLQLHILTCEENNKVNASFQPRIASVGAPD